MSRRLSVTPPACRDDRHIENSTSLPASKPTNSWIHALRTGPCWLVLTTLLVGCSESPPPIAELSGQTMGTGYSIKLSPAPDEDQRALLQKEVESRLEAIDAQMST